MEKIHLQVRVTGQVQGVFFRTSAKQKANELGITGWVRNEPDGSVLIKAEGTRSQLETFIAWCKQGPSSAQVESVQTEPVPVQEFKKFTIED